MKSFIVFAVSVSLVFGQGVKEGYFFRHNQPTVESNQTIESNPCDDKIFKIVEEKGFENLTDREFEYYRIKSQECQEYKNRQMLEEQAREQIREQQSQTRDQERAAREQVEALRWIGLLICLVMVTYSLFYSPDAIFASPSPPEI